jgi:hypothetical protein
MPEPSPTTPAEAAVRLAGPSLRQSLCRYLFYGWLFRDADHGSALERAMALRHNAAQARWLPTYLRRWGVGAAALSGLEFLSERIPNAAAVSAVLAVALIFATLFLLVTATCWAFLQAGRQSR